MIDVLIITDGRPCVADTLASATEMLHGEVGRWWIYCDSPTEAHRRRLGDLCGDALDRRRGMFTVFWHPQGRQGFGGAVRYAWSSVADVTEATHLFHLEDDFTFNRPVPLDDIARVLDTFPEIAQMALRRQPWNAAEIEAGGVVELRPDEFHDSAGVIARPDGSTVRLDWLEHQLFWTTNPSLIRLDHIRRHPWPDGEQSEGVYTHRLLDSDPNLRFGYWGARDSGEWVRHIGDERVGTGY